MLGAPHCPSRQVRHYIPVDGLPPWRDPGPGEPGWDPILNYCEVRPDEDEIKEVRSSPVGPKFAGFMSAEVPTVPNDRNELTSCPLISVITAKGYRRESVGSPIARQAHFSLALKFLRHCLMAAICRS